MIGGYFCQEGEFVGGICARTRDWERGLCAGRGGFGVMGGEDLYLEGKFWG